MYTYRPRSAVPIGVGLVAIGLAAGFSHLLAAGWQEASFTVALGALITIYGAVAYLLPRVEVTDDAVVVRNVLTTATVPFIRVAYVDTRWALEIRTDAGRKVTAFAAPAPGLWTARTAKSQDLEGLHPDTYVGGGARIGDRLGTPSGDAAAMVRSSVAAWREAHPDALADDSTPRTTRTVNVPAVALLAAAVGGLILVTQL